MKKLMLLLFLFISIIVFSESIEDQNYYSHIIILKNGSEYRGSLVRIDKDYVIFKINDKIKMFDKKTINSIQLHQKRMYEDVKTIDQINDPDISSLFEASDRFKINENLQIIMLLDKLKISFLDKNTIKYNIKKAYKILNVQGKDYSTQYFYYFKNISKAKLLYGITISKDGNVDCLDDSAISDEPVNNRYPQYDLLHRIKFGLKNVDIGSIIVWEAEITRSNDTLSRPFYIEKQLILDENILKQVVEVVSDDDFNYSLYEGKIDFYTGKFKKTTKGNQSIFTYVNEYIHGFSKDEQNIPSDRFILPFLCFSTINSWKKISTDFYNAYFDLPISDAINNLARSIIGNEDNAEKQLILLFNYLNRKIELANVSMYDFYFTPLSDDLLVSSPALNNLDKSYLFTRMAQALNIPVKMYFYKKNFNNPLQTKCPSISQFDSVICESNLNNISKYYSFENPNFKADQYYFSLSEAEALEVTKSNSEISRLKKIDYRMDKFFYTYKCELLTDNSMNILKTTTVIGSNEADWRNDRFLSKNEFDNIMQAEVSSFGTDASVIDYRFVNDLNDFEKHIIFEQNIQVKNYAINSGNKIKLIKIPELRYSASTVNRDSRRFPYDVGSPYVADYTFEITIPKNYKIGYLPKSVNIDNEFFSFFAEYKQKGNVIYIKIINIYKTDLIPVKSYSDLKASIEKKSKITNEWIILEVK
jgi:hypothetical protein